MNKRILAILTFSLLPAGIFAASHTGPGAVITSSDLAATTAPATTAAATGENLSAEQKLVKKLQDRLVSDGVFRNRAVKNATREDSWFIDTLRTNNWAKWGSRGAFALLSILYIRAQRAYSKAGAPSSFYPRLERAGLVMGLEKCESEEQHLLLAASNTQNQEELAQITARKAELADEKTQLTEDLARIERHLKRVAANRSSADTQRWIFGIGALASCALVFWPIIFSKHTPSPEEISNAALKLHYADQTS